MDRSKTTRETFNLDVFTPPPGPTLPVIPRPTVATPSTALIRQICTLFISEFQTSHLAALRSADFVTLTQIELSQNPTHTALPAPCGPYRPKASRAHLICRLNPKRLNIDQIQATPVIAPRPPKQAARPGDHDIVAPPSCLDTPPGADSTRDSPRLSPNVAALVITYAG